MSFSVVEVNWFVIGRKLAENGFLNESKKCRNEMSKWSKKEA